MCASIPRLTLPRELSCFNGPMYIAYLDEFGHIGPYISRNAEKFNESPVFGLAGIILPANQIRPFATWFYQRKCELLDFEIKQSTTHPATWEKKGSALFTAKNIEKYHELRVFTNRFLNKISQCGGKTIYVGLHKQASITEHKPLRLYLAVLRETLKRLNAICENDFNGADLMVVMDEHPERNAIVTAAGQSMFNKREPRRRLIEPPFQVESHRYQTVQAADWICGLVGRLGAYWVAPGDFPDWDLIDRYFGDRLLRTSARSGIRGDKKLQLTSLIRDTETTDPS